MICVWKGLGMYYTVEDGMEHCLHKFKIPIFALIYFWINPNAKEIFMYKNDELFDCIISRK